MIQSTNGIITGDARRLGRVIPDRRVDLLFTDPPYPQEYLYLYKWLAEYAARVLKPDGFLLVYSGEYWKGEVMAYMREHLDYWLNYVALSKGDAPILWMRNTICRHKSILAYRPRGGTGKPNGNVLSVYTGAGKDKRWHPWGQDEMTAQYFIQKFSEPGDLVHDPFCGGGTIPAVCKTLDQQCIAFEIDPSAAALSRLRLAGALCPGEPLPLTDLPLFAQEGQTP